MFKRKNVFKVAIQRMNIQNALNSNKNFEHNKKIVKLKFLIIIVRKGQGVAISSLLIENGAAMTAISFAQGTKEKYVVDIFGGDEQHKEVITAVINEKRYENVKSAIKYRFGVSNSSKGVLLAFDIAACAGVSAYKYLSDFEGAFNNGK